MISPPPQMRVKQVFNNSSFSVRLFDFTISFLLYHFFKGISGLNPDFEQHWRGMKVVLIGFPEAMNHLASTDVLMVVYTAKNGPQELKGVFLTGDFSKHFRTIKVSCSISFIYLKHRCYIFNFYEYY